MIKQIIYKLLFYVAIELLCMHIIVGRTNKISMAIFLAIFCGLDIFLYTIVQPPIVQNKSLR